MKASGFYAVLGFGVLIMGLVAWFGWRYQQQHADATATVATNTTESGAQNLSGQAIYSNGEYGFSVVYPENTLLEDTFSNTYHLSAFWRANALSTATGTPVVAIVGYRTNHEH